jgi:hypothetical protein
MPVTIKDIKSIFNTNTVDQVKSMQLFIVNNNILVSYRTIIGMLDNNDCWHITNKKYSSSTSRQTSRFKRHNYHVIVDDIVVQDMQSYYYPTGI